MTRLLPILGLTLLTACVSDVKEIGREPLMTPVGAGLSAHTGLAPAYPTSQGRRGYHSLWTDAREDLFRDGRAMKPGDVVTVKIFMDDQARLNNSSGRSRDSGAEFGANFGFDTGKTSRDGSLSADLTSRSTSRGQGTIDRSERIELSVAAVVSDVLPNGNLIISGSQEVRVNYEMRVLTIAGIARPRDIAANNTISYDKIAEARISYGGRGRSMEVQQPGWGQQLYDKVMPF